MVVMFHSCGLSFSIFYILTIAQIVAVCVGFASGITGGIVVTALSTSTGLCKGSISAKCGIVDCFVFGGIGITHARISVQHNFHFLSVQGVDPLLLYSFYHRQKQIAIPFLTFFLFFVLFSVLHKNGRGYLFILYKNNKVGRSCTVDICTPPGVYCGKKSIFFYRFALV